MQGLQRRLVLFIPTFVGALTLVFVLMRILPGDPAAAMLGSQATAAGVRDLRSQMGLDKPMLLQFGEYFGGLARLDLGRSLALRTPVIQLLGAALPPTLLVTLGGTLVSLVVGIPLGVIAALRRGKWGDYAASTTALLGISAPGFVWALLLLFAFTLYWPILPSAGTGNDFIGTLKSLVLPSIASGAFLVGLIARITRSSLLSVLNQDYVRTARAKGLRKLTILNRHSLANALIPVMTVVGLNIGVLLGGVVVVETVFTRPGLGRLTLDAIAARDYPVIQGVMVVAVIVVVALNLIVDLLYNVVDPRIRV